MNKLVWVGLLLTSIFCLVSTQTPPKKNYRVLILGAGMAGLSAAARLEDQGITDYVILEGSNRVGGRVYSSQFMGTPVEFGANWINGWRTEEANTNPLAPLREAAGLKCTPNASPHLYTGQGAVTDEGAATAFRLTEPVWPMLFGLVNSTNDMSYVAGWNAAIALHSEWFGQNVTTIEGVPDPIRAIIYSIIANGGNNPEVSSLYRGSFAQTGAFGQLDCLVNDAGGYVKILNTLIQQKNLRSKIFTGQVVTKIDYSAGNSVSVTVQGDNTPYVAQAVIVTFSLGVLKNRVDLFAPPLSVAKRSAINRWGYGNLLKVWLKFPRAWWPNEDTAWYYSDGRADKYYPNYFINLNHQNLVPGSATVLFFAIDSHADRIIRQTPQQTIDEIMVVFKNMFGTKDFVAATNVTFYNWAADPFHYGTYSFGRLNATDEDYNQMIAAVGDGRVIFAGEHTSRAFWGYVHGSYLEGIYAANNASAITTGPTSSPVSPTTTRVGTTTTKRSSASALSISAVLSLVFLVFLL